MLGRITMTDSTLLNTMGYSVDEVTQQSRTIAPEEIVNEIIPEEEIME